MTYAEKHEKLQQLEDQDLLCRECINDAYELGLDDEVANLKARLKEIRREYNVLERMECT